MVQTNFFQCKPIYLFDSIKPSLIQKNSFHDHIIKKSFFDSKILFSGFSAKKKQTYSKTYRSTVRADLNTVFGGSSYFCKTFCKFFFFNEYFKWNINLITDSIWIKNFNYNLTSKIFGSFTTGFFIFLLWSSVFHIRTHTWKNEHQNFDTILNLFITQYCFHFHSTFS